MRAAAAALTLTMTLAAPAAAAPTDTGTDSTQIEGAAATIAPDGSHAAVEQVAFRDDGTTTTTILAGPVGGPLEPAFDEPSTMTGGPQLHHTTIANDGTVVTLTDANPNPNGGQPSGPPEATSASDADSSPESATGPDVAQMRAWIGGTADPRPVGPESSHSSVTISADANHIAYTTGTPAPDVERALPSGQLVLVPADADPQVISDDAADLTLQDATVNAGAFTGDGATLVFIAAVVPGSIDEPVEPGQVFTHHDGTLSQLPGADGARYAGASISSDGTQVAATTNDGQLTVWPVSDGQPDGDATTSQISQGRASAPAWTDGNVAVTITDPDQSRTLHATFTTAGEQVGDPIELAPHETTAGHSRPPAVSNDGNVVATVDYHGEEPVVRIADSRPSDDPTADGSVDPSDAQSPGGDEADGSDETSGAVWLIVLVGGLALIGGAVAASTVRHS